ncbi:MAG: FABP family protein [Candidatus Nanopelagicales bacterium]|nr:FABP family protein [Candidatus Nanopelagicales bacterium]
MQPDAALPPELAPLSWLIGHWVGVGTGQYPTIGDFRFGQEVSFSTDGRPFLAYASRSWLLDDEGTRLRPLASESGFLRPRPDNHLEMQLSHPTGYAEIWYGRVEITGIEQAHITGARVELRTDLVARTQSAKEYVDGHRLYGLVEGRLLWTFDMAAMGQPLTNHLAATLHRLEDPA